MTEAQAQLARALMEAGAVLTKFTTSGAGEGFRLKLHEKHPDAPLSPIFFNLRTRDNPTPGPLTPELLQDIAAEFISITHERNLSFTVVAGIPNAGDPLATAFVRVSPAQLPPPLHFEKRVEDGRRTVVGLAARSDRRGVPGDVVLFLDDVVTEADTKREAIAAARRERFAVRDIIVLIDREQGGAAGLAQMGVTLHAIFTVSSLIRLYVAEGSLTQAMGREIEEYLATIRA